MNINNCKSRHLISNFYDVNCSPETNFNEEDILQSSKLGHLQQEDPCVICYIYEDNEVVDEQQNTSLQFPKKFQQQFIFATTPWKHSHCIEEECNFQDIVDESRILDVFSDKEKYENIFKLESSHPAKDNNNHEQPIIDFIGLWFQSIVFQSMEPYFNHILLSFTSVYFGNYFYSLIVYLTCSPIQ